MLPEVPDEEPAGQTAPPLWQTAPPAVRQPPRAGAPAKAAPPPAAPPSRAGEAPSWRDAPPPVRQPGGGARDEHATEVRRRGSAADTVRLNRPADTQRRSPHDTAYDVAARVPDGPPTTTDTSSAGRPAPELEAAPRVGRKRARWVMLGLVAGVIAVVGSIVFLVLQSVQKGEAELRAQAMEDYRGGKYSRAAQEFGELIQTFPSSDQNPTDRFLADWSALAALMHDPDADSGAVADKLVVFLKEHRDDAALATYGRDIAQALAKVAEAFAQRNANPEGTGPLAVAVRLDEARTLLRKGAGSDAFADGADGRIEAAQNTVRVAVDRWQRRTAFLARLKKLPGTAGGLRDARNMLREPEPLAQNLPDAPEVRDILRDMEERHLDAARRGYGAAEAAEPLPVRQEQSPPSIVFVPPLGTAPGSPPDDPVRLALARGVLYALRQSNGAVKWVRRVGIDTTALPEHVPPSQVFRDRFLVVSSDSRTLTALDAEGNAVWEYRLEHPALGRPLKVDNRIYLPTYDGYVHEIEVARGALLGRYNLGQRLATGGVQEEGSKRLYFAADDSCVYVLDVGQRTCVRVLYTGHPSGSLRSEPVVIPPVKMVTGEATPGFLVLNQADGLDAVRLRVFELPLTEAHQSALSLSPEPRLEGWTWFKPRYDAETMAVLSDRGKLGLFGIRQANNKDQALFPLLSPGGLDLAPFLDTAGIPQGARRGRSQVVYAEGNDFWVLAHGRLQRIGLAWNGRAGPQAAAGWPSSLSLGSPLHDSQVAQDRRRGQATLFVVTQPLDRQMCMATAVNAENGHVIWQRQLGLVCLGEPVQLAPPDGGAPMSLALDQSGSLFALDPTRFPAGVRNPWQTGGQNIAGALTDNPRVPPALLLAPDGHTAYEVACPGDGGSIVVRQIDWEPGTRRLFVKAERTLPLESKNGPLFGTPAVLGPWLVLPTRDGPLARLSLPLAEDAALDYGPDWRGEYSPPDARCHVAALGEDLFLTTDGGRRLRCWQWGKAATWTSLPQEDPEPERGLELSDPISAPPVVLPGGSGLLARVCVADAGHTLSLLTVRANGALRVTRTWDLGGPITGRPLVRKLPGGQLRIGCIIKERRLLWIDPNQAGKSWEYTAAGPIVGSPEVIDGLVVVADQGGHVVGLDASTGARQGPGYTLHGSAVPVASPVPFGPRRALVPACDGTAVLLTLDYLLHPLRSMPPIW
jgi:hypothetical protein